MIEKNRPSLLRIVRTDYAAFFVTFVTVMFWVILGFDLLRGAEISRNLRYAVVGTTVVGVIVFLWRTMTIYAIFNDGQESTAIINHVSFYRGRGAITYIHESQGEKYRCTNTLLRNGRTKELAEGDKVVILVDRNNPKKAHIKDLYL